MPSEPLGDTSLAGNLERRGFFVGSWAGAALALTAGSFALDSLWSGRALPAVVTRLERAMNSADADEVAACFARNYKAVTPHHPSRDFTGNDQVRRNWATIFAQVPNHQGRLLRWSVGGDGSVWTEWQMTGTTTSGTPYHATGPAILTIRGRVITTARFYVDQVDAPPKEN